MATHWIVFDDATTDTGEAGLVDVAVDPAAGMYRDALGPAVSFTVFDNGTTSRRDFSVNTNADGYASSGDLIPKTAHPPMLVRASILGWSWATMRRWDGGGRLVTIPDAGQAMGTSFGIALGGGPASSFHLLVGNPNGADALVTLQYGGSSAAVASTTSVPAEGAVKIPLTAGECLLVMRSNSAVFVQLALGGPERFDVSFVLPP